MIKTLKRFLSAFLAFVMTAVSVGGLLVTPTFAATTTYGDFKVTTEDGTCSYEDNVLTLSDSGTYTIEMADGVTSTSTDRIVTYGGTVTLNNVNITSSENSPFIIFENPLTVSFSSYTTLNLKLSGTNTLISTASGCSGIQKDKAVRLKITSTDGDGSTNGDLTVTGGEDAAGIGGGNYIDGSNITINGGTITATGSNYAAGIGGSYYSDGSNITINGGSVTANGIGGGYYGDGNNITINGGNVVSTQTIGGGFYGNGNTITINDGTVVASSSRNYGAGIGGCRGSATSSLSDVGNGTNIIINGGTVTATGGSYGAGIGGAGNADGSNIIINGGTVTANSTSGASIGGGYNNGYSGGNGTDITINGGYINLSKTSDNAAYIGGGGRGTTGTVNILGGYFTVGSLSKNTVYNVTPILPLVTVSNIEASSKSAYPYTVGYIQSLEISDSPSTTNYIEGQSFDTSGMTVKAVYSNGYSKTVTSYSYSPETLSADDTEVYIIYDDVYSSVYATVPVSVAEKEVESIAVTSQPTKQDYIVGQAFDPDGMVVEATYTDGSTAKIDNDYLTFTLSEGDDYFDSVGTNIYVTVSYAGKTATTDYLTVVAKKASSITVSSVPSDLNFYKNETYTQDELTTRLDSDGLELTVTYNDGTTAVIANSAADIVLNGNYSNINGTLTYYVYEDEGLSETYASAITVTYDGIEISIPITILENALTGIEVTSQPTKTAYTEGESLDTSGMVVMAFYSDGTTNEITNYSVSSLSGTGSVTVYVTYGGFYDTVTVDVEEAVAVTMTGIKVTSQPTNATYVAGEAFDTSGMIIEAVYSDGSTSEVTDYNYSPSILSESDTSVIITYGNYYTTFPVSVSAKEITKIEVTTAPTKTEYIQGEVFNPSGMIITATYSDNTTADLASSEYSYSTEALTTVGNINFEISAANCTATTPITVIKKEISSISVTQYPDKIYYYDGQSFDSSGMIVQAEYNDGSTAVISDYTVSPTVLTSGDTEVTVSKDGFSDTVKITVSEKSLSRIAVTSQPNVVSYISGETFNSSGMTVTAYYNDNSSEVITDYTITNPTMTAGTDTVYITYGDLYTTVSVTVTEKTVTGIEVSSQPSKSSYISGETFDTSGMVINIVYSDGSYEEITNYSYSPVTLSTSDTSVLITYGNYFTTVPVSVASKEITGIEIETYPDKVTYVEGEIFDDSGMVVLATYNDNSTSYLASNEYSYSSDSLSITDYYVSVYAGSASAVVPVRVIDKEITGISITEYPDKVSYYVGQSFDPSGMTVVAEYNDGSTAVISDYTVSPSTITSGTTEVVISKDGYSDTVKISVSDITLKSIVVTTSPTKTSYISGQTFDASGMIITGYFNDGSTAEITDYSISNSVLTSGTETVYITYDGLYTTVPVSVSDKIMTGISILSQPNKTSYIAGESFNTDGMVLAAEYNDGSSEEIENYSVSPSILSVGDSSVMITYNNYYTTIDISVAEKEITDIEIETYPDKVTYVEGEIFDDDGMIVLAVYNDGSTSYLASNEYTYSTDPLTTSDYYVTVYAGSASAVVPIRVIDKTITGITVTEYPDKLSYITGQAFDPSGMTVVAEYNDGSSAVITDYTVSPETVTSDTTEIIISKDGYSDTVKISVSDIMLTSIAVTSAPTKVSYYAGQTFDPSGMTITGYYNNGSTAEITDYTISNPILASGTSLIYVTYDNLFTTVAVSVSEKVLTGISIKQQPDTISYIAGQSFNNTGMIVSANYSDGTSEEITDYSVSPSILSISDTTIMITYNGYYATIDVSVAAKEVESVSVVSQPSKTNYVEGETFNADGLIAEVTYNDGSVEYMTGGSSELSYSTDPLTINDTAVTVTVGGKTADVPVSVVKKEIVSIMVTEAPTKINYVVGETVDLSGIEVEATFNDGSSAIIEDYEYSPSTISADTKEIVVSKDGYSDSVSIAVSEKSIVSLEVTKQPDIISYFAGQSFDSTGMIISITYNDGSTEEISDYSIINSVLSLDTEIVYITYGSLFTTVDVTVSEKVLTGIEVTAQPKTSYVVGQAFDTSGMVVTGYYSDGSTEEVTGYEVDTDTLISGQTKVYVTYGGYYDVVNVSVVAKEVTNVEIISHPTKDSYVEGETFNPEGIVIKVTYNDGEEELMTYDNAAISYPSEPLTTNDTTVDITVGGVSAEVKISVTDKEITGIQVVTAPNKIDYIVGQNFNPDGMTVLAYFNDGTSAEISDYSFTPETVSANTDEITIIKDGFTDTVKIAVTERVITNIAVTTLPNKVEYTENDTFDPAGMIVTAYFNDNTEEEITNYNVDDFLLSTGTSVVYITYENLFATVDITVNSKTITAIEIITPPVTTEYVEGQSFNTAGMVVKAYYDDNSSAILESYDYTPSGSLTLNDTVITVRKNGATAEQAITVIERAATGIEVTKNPDKTDYTEGDVFNPDGMEIAAYYNDGSTEIITDYTYPTEPFAEGDTSVIISYDGYTAEVEITLSVDDILAYIAERNGDVNRDGNISQEDALILMRYLAGTADLVDYAIHTGDVDGDSQLTDKDVTLINNHISGNSTLNEVSAIEADIDGDGDVTETDLNLVRKAVLNMWVLDTVYEANADANDDGEINMLDVIWILTHYKKATTIDYIYVASQPDKTEYVEGQTFDPEGMTVIAVYLDGTEEEITDYTYPLDALETTDTAVEIEYEGYTTEVEITVVEKRIGFDTTENSTETTTKDNTLDSSSETTTKDNTSDSSSETTTNSNSDGSSETTTNGKTDGSSETTTKDTSDSTTETTTKNNSDSSSETTTEVNYGNSDGVVILNLPTKTTYVEGETFDPVGILILLYWNDGSVSYITEDDVTVDETPLSVGDIYGVIYYEYKNDTEKINVPITVTEITTETTTEAATETTTDITTETTTKKSSGGGGGGSGSSSSHTTTTEAATEVTTEADNSNTDGSDTANGTNDSENAENTNTENSESDGSSKGFTDVSGHWAKEYIEYLHNLGIVNGVDDETYSPDLSTKRGDFAVILNKLLNLEDGNVTFDDVDSDSYYAQAISNCAAADIFIGYGNSIFKPEQVISRQEMFVIMAKLFVGADYDFSAVDLTSLDSFADGSAVSEWAKPYTAYLVSVGAVVGDDNELRPRDNITRAEMAVIIYNYLS